MAKRKNLYKMDDICLFLSVITFLIFLFQFRPLLPYFKGSDFNLLLDVAKNIILASPIKMGGLLFSAIFLQIVGRVVRKKEIISMEVIDAISYRSRASVEGLASELGRDAESLEKIIKQLAAIPGAGVSYDGKYVKIDRGESKTADDEYARDKDRMMNGEFSMSDNSAEDDYSEDSSIDEDGFPEDFPDVLKKVGVKPEDLKDKFERIRAEQRTTGNSSIPAYTAQTGSDGKKLRPNPVLLIILFLVFWPLGIIYLISFYMKNMQKNALQEGIKKTDNRS
ncbi:MAG: hypothetical protein JEY99_14390 [Spirochaetales bacterium]|nr:hypothetical protein [Spirochaetales bacterium]